MLPALVLSFAILSQAPTVTDQPEPPSASGGRRVARIAVELGSSMVGGLVFAAAGFVSTCYLESQLTTDAMCIPAMILFAPLGYVLGSVAGTYLGGRLMGGDGGFGWTLLGGALGGIATLAGVIATAAMVGTSEQWTVTLIAAGLLPIFGSIIGYELSCSAVEPTLSFAPGPNPKAQLGVRWRF